MQLKWKRAYGFNFQLVRVVVGTCDHSWNSIRRLRSVGGGLCVAVTVIILWCTMYGVESLEGSTFVKDGQAQRLLLWKYRERLRKEREGEREIER